MINYYSQEIIDKLKAKGRPTDYLEQLAQNRKYQGRQPKHTEVELFTETYSEILKELTEEEVLQMQTFGRVLVGSDLNTLNERKPLLVERYERNNKELLSEIKSRIRPE